MKIGKIQNQYTNNGTKINNKRNSDKATNEKSVKVDISETARQLAEKINRAEEPDMSEKVEKIRTSILNGSYKVSSEEIADKILQEIRAQKGSDEQ